MEKKIEEIESFLKKIENKFGIKIPDINNLDRFDVSKTKITEQQKQNIIDIKNFDKEIKDNLKERIFDFNIEEKDDAIQLLKDNLLSLHLEESTNE
jgi:hypothetical protein